MSVAKSVTITLAVLALAGATLFGVDRYGRGSRSFGSVGALTDSRVPKFLVDTPQDAYRVWKAAGARGRQVLFISGRWERLPDDGIDQDIPMSRPYPLRLFQIAEVQESRYLGAANFLYVAALNGMARSIVALLSAPGYAEMREAARSSKYGRVGANEVYLPHQGYPRWFTDAEHFRGEREPVLLYVAAPYFREGSPDELFRQLQAQRLQSDCIILCRWGADPSPGSRELAGLQRFAHLIGMPAAPRAAAGPAPAAGRER
jgi:hypothetical protein